MREIFLWGCLGSLAIEVVTAYKAINDNNGRLPVRYRRAPFLVVRLLLAIVAGGLAVAYGIEKPLLAVHIGAATPLILQTFARTIPLLAGPTPSSGSSGDGRDAKPTTRDRDRHGTGSPERARPGERTGKSRRRAAEEGRDRNA